MTAVGGGTRTGSPDEGLMLTTKGDIHSFDNEDKRLPVGSDGQVLTADSLQALGVKWAAQAVGFNLTTKGDIHTFDTDQNRLPVGTDGQVLTANAAVGLGIEWATPAPAEVFTWTNNHDADSNNLLNMGILKFAEVSPVFVNGEVTIQRGTVQFFFQAEAAGTFDFVLGTSLEYQFNATQLDLRGHPIDNVTSLTSNASPPATAGAIRLGNTEVINWRNFANTNNIGITVDVNDDFIFRIDGTPELVVSSLELNLQGNNLRMGGVAATIFFDDNAHNILQSASDMRYNTAVSQGHSFFVDNVLQMLIDATALTLSTGNNLVIQGSGATGFLDIGEITVPADPSANVGRLYVKDVTATTTLFFRDSAGVETNLLAGGAVQTPIAQDIEYAGFDIKDISNLEFRVSTGVPAAGVQAIYLNAAGLHLNVPTNEAIIVTINGVDQMSLTDTELDMSIGTGKDLLIGDGRSIRWGTNREIQNDTSGFRLEVEAGDDFEFRFNNVLLYDFTEAALTLVGGNNLIIQGSGATGFIDISEITVPANPTANIGRLYVKDLAAVTTLFFRDSAGTETNVLTGAAGEFFGPWTALHDASGQTLDNIGALISNATNPADADVIRFGVDEGLTWRNAANTANVGLKLDAANRFELRFVDLSGIFRTIADHTTPAAGQIVQVIEAIDDDSLGVERPYATIRTEIRDPTAASRDGTVLYQVAEAQTNNDLTNYLGLNVNNDNNVRCFRSLLIDDAKDIILRTTTGTKLGTGITQKLAFWNATPIIQPTHIADPSGGATVDAEARTAIDAINALLASTGLSAAA